MFKNQDRILLEERLLGSRKRYTPLRYDEQAWHYSNSDQNVEVNDTVPSTRLG